MQYIDDISSRDDPNVFSTKINIPGLGSVPAIVQQLPNGQIQVLSISADLQLAMGMAPHNDHSYFHTPSMFTNPNQFTPTSYYSIQPDMTYGGQFNPPQDITYNQIPSTVPPLQMIDTRFQNNHIVNIAQTSRATLKNDSHSQAEMPNPNIVLREIMPPAHSNNFNSNKPFK
ncbi:hypothetical protein MXB_110 [Myxobolus squamalis]|nr:hypothetical protein MXB_110 [Myxobolus squamalis]